ncbi:gp41 [Burkholderia pseudomallei]|nr:gp41 [Burkholderia pseudomallei]
MTTTENSRADALTDLSDDELALIREEAARITDDWCERQFMEPSQKESDAKFVREVLRLAASPSSQPAAAPADLQGLRRSILTSREIVRDQDGMLSHPAVPYLDEDVNYETFFAAFGIEATFIHMEDDVDCDTYDRYFASNSPDCCTWTPSSPQGDGWMLLEIYDTEDGPVALYVREKKPESMRERWKREKRESDAAAPSPADERAAKISDYLNAPGMWAQVYCCAVFVRGWPSDMARSAADEAAKEFGDAACKTVADLTHTLDEVLRVD